jgi:hypothetical protein
LGERVRAALLYALAGALQSGLYLFSLWPVEASQFLDEQRVRVLAPIRWQEGKRAQPCIDLLIDSLCLRLLFRGEELFIVCHR